MKKFLAILMTLAMVFGVCSAVAEEIPALTADPVENGAVVPFEDYNFQITVPSDWLVLEVSDEQAEAGIIYGFASADQARTLFLSYSEFEEATDIDAVAADIATQYTNVARLTINGIDFVTYDVEASNSSCLGMLGGSGIGFYQFFFTPATDEEYGPLARSIAASISAIE
ncbi:MAG: hypothetical protein PHY12_11385 [Eubacteriales bacterium]|nr:hypothetical protein [Eubacteriales bacterium]